jgi:hypothetical protein
VGILDIRFGGNDKPPDPIGGVLGNGNRRQDADDGDNNHQLYQSKTLFCLEVSVLHKIIPPYLSGFAFYSSSHCLRENSFQKDCNKLAIPEEIEYEKFPLLTGTQKCLQML